MVLDLTPDQLLSTTRTVRRRLDFDRPVDQGLIQECLTLAVQAPTRSNSQAWKFLVVCDQATRAAIGEIYRRAFEIYRSQSYSAANLFGDQPLRQAAQARVMDSAAYLALHIHEAPVHVIPCLSPRAEAEPGWRQASYWGSILPATWSFMLAARARGLGVAWTTLHLMFEEELASLLGIPYESVLQAALLPVAHTKGTRFGPAQREPLDSVVFWERWGGRQPKG